MNYHESPPVVITVIRSSSAPQRTQAHGAAVDELQEQFLALVCADEDLLRAEFDAIITASWDQPDPPAQRPGARRPSRPGRPRPRRRRVQAGLRGPQREASGDHRGRQRAPPQDAPATPAHDKNTL